MPRASSRAPTTHTGKTPVVHQPPQQSAGFGTMMKQGFALGAGQAVAHQVVGSLFSTPAKPDCSAYKTCLTKVDKSTCDTLYEQCATP